MAPAEARSKIEARIAKVEELLARTTMIFTGGGELEQFDREVVRWRSVTRELILNLFDTSDYAEGFSMAQPMKLYSPYTSAQVRFNDAHTALRAQVGNLQGLLETIDMLSDLPAHAPVMTVEPPKRPAPIHVTITNSTVGNVVLDSLVEKIDSHVKATAGMGAAELAEAWKAITQAVEAESDLSAETRTEALSYVEYLADEGTKPEAERRGTIIKAALQGLGTVLSTVSKAGAVWTQWAPIIDHALKGHLT